MTRIAYLIWFGKVLAAWPAAVRIAASQLLSSLLLILPNRRRDRAGANIARCFPAMEQAQQRQLLKQHLRHRTLSLLETGLLWHCPVAKLLATVTETEGEAVLQAAQRRGRGVIVAVPHFGQWELTGLYLSATLTNTAMLYKPPTDARADALLRQYRERTGGRAVPATAAGIRRLLQILRAGGFVGILPDQRPKAGQGRTAMFFNQPAQTMTLLTRLVRKTRCEVVFAGCERLADKRSFRLRFIAAPFGIDADDDAIALAALNQGIEQVAQWSLPQYQWSYNRFAGAANQQKASLQKPE